MNAAATANKQGVNFSIHSDAPVTPLAPLFTAWCAINRRTASGLVLGEHERISLNDALYAITMGAAYTLKLDHVVGSIESGKFADFAVLEEDHFLVEPDQRTTTGCAGRVRIDSPWRNVKGIQSCVFHPCGTRRRTKAWN